MSEIFYKKVGRKYVAVASGEMYNYDLKKPNGFILTYRKDCRTAYAYEVKPDNAAFVAAAMVARQAMEEAMHEAVKMQPSGGVKPYTTKQRQLIKQFQEDMGGMIPIYWQSKTSWEIAQAGIDAVRSGDAELMIKSQAIKDAVTLLENHNVWRQSGEGEMVNSKELSLALALAIKHLRGQL